MSYVSSLLASYQTPSSHFQEDWRQGQQIRTQKARKEGRKEVRKEGRKERRRKKEGRIEGMREEQCRAGQGKAWQGRAK